LVQFEKWGGKEGETPSDFGKGKMERENKQGEPPQPKPRGGHGNQPDGKRQTKKKKEVPLPERDQNRGTCRGIHSTSWGRKSGRGGVFFFSIRKG